MSDTAKSPAPGAVSEAPKFTERELQILGWAMQSLKSGPPEIDTEKLANFAGMTNPRSAGNAWGALKKKLMTPGDGSAPPTPKKGGGRKKATKDDTGKDSEATPVKTPRKRAAKEPEEGDASPKKKSRAAKPKPKPKQEPEEESSEVEAESEPAEGPKPEIDAVKSEIEEEV